MLAKLLIRPANLIILDEPTNDLDIETLELLESLLTEYQGTLLLVSHDRAFIDNTVTSSWWYAGNGHWSEYVGGYQDAVDQGAKFYSEEPSSLKTVEAPATPTKAVEVKAAEPVKAVKKLSYKLQRELESLPNVMEQLEEDILALQTTIGNPDFYSQAQDKVNQVLSQLADKEKQLEVCFERWEELESLK